MNYALIVTISTSIHEFGPTLLIVVILLLLFGVYLLINHKNKKDSFIRYIRYFLLPVTFLGGLAVYFWGYQFGKPEATFFNAETIPNFFESIFSTTRLFILGNDLIEISDNIKHVPLFHAMFSLTVFLAAFIFISFLAHVFFKDWLTRTKIKFIRPAENHFFFGINNASLSLSKDLLKDDKNTLVVFINDFCDLDNQQDYLYIHENAYVLKRKSILESINLEKEEGLLQLFKKKESHEKSENCTENVFHRLTVLKKKIDNRDTHIYFFSDDDDWNIKHARQAIAELNELIETKNKNGEIAIKPKSIRIHVATWNEISEKHFINSLENNRCISVVVHNYATLVSRKLIEKYHPVDFIEIDSEQAIAKTDFNALIIGFGQIGTHVLRKLIEQGQFVGSEFKVTVIDKLMHVKEGRFEHLYPGVKDNYDVDFIEAEVGHHTFYKTVKDLIDKVNYIVIALGNDELNIQTALELLEINSIKERKLFRIFIQLEDENHWKETLYKYESQISIFGESDEVFSESNILQRDVEMSGKLVHQVYNNLYGGKDSFEFITRHEQLSNISAAEHLYAKVKLLGNNSLVEFSSNFDSNDAFIKSLKNDQELNMSIGEHLRWNAFHFIHGWTTLPMGQIPGNTPKEKYGNRKNTELRIHSCLISWEDLDKLKNVLENDMQIADTNSVLHLYDFINAPYQDDQTQH